MRELLEQYEHAALRASQTKKSARVSEATLLAFFELTPFPAWIKAVRTDGSLHMIRVNKAYEKEVGITAEEYENQTDFDVQSESSAAEFNANDWEAIRRGEVLYVVEHDTHQTTGHVREWCVWKWPVKYDDTVIAVCGIAMGPDYGRG